MFNITKREYKRSSRATTNTTRLAKHSSSEPSTPGPRAPVLRPQGSTGGIIHGLQNLSFHSSERVSDRNPSSRVPSNPIPIPTHRYTTLTSFVAPSIPHDEMKHNDITGVRSPLTSMTTESAMLEDDDGSTLGVNNSPSPKEPISPDSLGMDFDDDSGDQYITLDILTSDDEIGPKRPDSRSIFSSAPSSEPRPPCSQPISIPLAGLRRSQSQS